MLKTDIGLRRMARGCVPDVTLTGGSTAAAKDHIEPMTSSELTELALSVREREIHPARTRRVLLDISSVAEGFMLRTWRGGPKAGQPKLPPAAASMIERGLLRLDVTVRPPRVFFTNAGIAALRDMIQDRRLADPKKFAHIRQKLGIDPSPESEADAAASATL